MNEMRQYEPNIDMLENVGDNLLKSSRTRESERERITNERAEVVGEWDKLNSLAHRIQSKSVPFLFLLFSVLNGLLAAK